MPSMNELHEAAVLGSVERTAALLSSGSFDIDGCDEGGRTPLMMASIFGHSHVVRILLDEGASVAMASKDGYTALFVAAQKGHLAVTKLLVNAGSNTTARSVSGSTPLHPAAAGGHLEVMSVLIGAGAHVDSRCSDGATPLFLAADEGNLGAVKVLLRAKANPLLAAMHPEKGTPHLPLDAAAMMDHSEVARELLRQRGVEGCDGATRALHALCLATLNDNLETMVVLTGGGVVDGGEALMISAERGPEASVKLLLKTQVEGKSSSSGVSYVNHRTSCGRTPLLCAAGFYGVGSAHPPCTSPRIVRLLVDAGADTTSASSVTDREGRVVRGTPLVFTTRMLREKKVAGKDATEEQLHRLERIRRLLLRVEAVHAVSWLWPSELPFVARTAESRGTTASTPLRKMLPLLRRRAISRGVPSATLSR